MVGIGYSVFPQKRKKNYTIEFMGGIANTYIPDNAGYFDLSGTSKNPFTGQRDSIKGFSSYIGVGSSIRIKGPWSFRINTIHRRYEFKMVEGIRNTPVNIQVGLCYGVM